MKKSMTNGTAGTGDGNLVLYSGPDFSGDSKKFSESDSTLKQTWGKTIKSMIIEGNPWSFYPEEGMKVS